MALRCSLHITFGAGFRMKGCNDWRLLSLFLNRLEDCIQEETQVAISEIADDGFDVGQHQLLRDARQEK